MKKYTDQEFLYRQTPVNYDGIAKFTSIKGNTLVWNQLADIKLASTSSGGITYTNNEDGSFTLNGTATAQVDFRISTTNGTDNLYNYPTGKYLLICNGISSSVQFIIMSYPDYVRMATFTSSPFLSLLPVTGRDNCFMMIRIANGTTLNNVKFKPQLFNLTAMFGQGNEPTTAEEFTSLFPLPYYAYDSGSLLSFNGNGTKTTGANLILFADGTRTGAGITGTVSNGVFSASGTATSTYANLNYFNELKIENGEVYTVRLNKALSYGITFRFATDTTDSTFQQVTIPAGSQIVKFTANNDYNYVRLYISGITSGTVVSFSGMIPMIAHADLNTFKPYTESTASLPVLTYFPTGMKSAGNVYDELTPNKASERVGSMTLDGSQSASVSIVGSYTRLSVVHGASNVKYPNAQQESNYLPYMVSFSEESNHFYANGSQAILIMKSSVVGTTVDSFNSYLQSHPLTIYYELATETETEIDAEIFYPFYGDGTEQILPVNGSTPTTAPIIADIVYYTKIDTNTPYRKFWLVNGNGDRWNLTEKEVKSFLDSPQGLGFQKSIDVTRYGERAYKNTEDYNFPQVSGDILFYDTINATRYEKYNEFVRFLMVQPLTLYYQIPVSIYSGMADIYTLDCEVINLTKTESKTNRVLTSNIQISGLGFYQGDTVEINGTSTTVTINNDGDFPVGFEIEINGDFENPYITLEQNGELYGEAKFVDEGTNFSSVYVDSKDGEQNVVLKQNDSILPNPLAYQDLSISNGSVYVTFVKLAKGESTLTIGADSYTISGYTIKFTPTYRSV